MDMLLTLGKSLGILRFYNMRSDFATEKVSQLQTSVRKVNTKVAFFLISGQNAGEFYEISAPWTDRAEGLIIIRTNSYAI